VKIWGKVRKIWVEVQQELVPQEVPLIHEQEMCLGRSQCPQPGQAPVGNLLTVWRIEGDRERRDKMIFLMV